ncbi:hypothetical protein CFOL_v3_08942 [Cephalotus follicularis]|uniref:C2H2-type domain-containing protein n=1 Tax=Cephalotus follicularis TaxID=3775 RepID=A0A1Q3BBK5_CEPFO|nr:hypothetical protein CFOL_v3_08942 [Cephalotus follicularis]
MAGLGWNIRQSNMPGLNHAYRRPYNPTHIACRICDQVFTSTHGLINHIESHMIDDETLSRRHNEINLMSSQPLTNPFQSNFSLLAPQPPIQNVYNFPGVQERNPFLGSTPQIVAPPRSTQPPPPPSPQPQQSQLSLLGRNNFTFRPQPVPSSSRVVQDHQPPNDCTKPLLDQLERTMPNIVESLRRDKNSHGKSHEMLDLSLKL